MADPNIYVIDNIFDVIELERLLSQMHELPLSDAMVGNGGIARVDYKFRVSKHSKLPKENSAYKWVFDRINQQVDPLNQQQWKFPLRPELTDIEYNEYEAENGSHFGWHSDKHDSGPRSTRRLTIIIQLSRPEEYAGGGCECAPSHFSSIF